MSGQAGVEALRTEANEHFRKKRYPEAIKAYTAALALQPDQAVVYANRGAANIKLQRWAEAEADCSHAIRLDPKHVKARTRRAKARVELGQWQGALDDLAAATALDPAHEEAQAELKQQAEQGLQQQQQGQQQQQEAAGATDSQASTGTTATPGHCSTTSITDAPEHEAEVGSAALLVARKRLAALARSRPSGLQTSISELPASAGPTNKDDGAAADAGAAAAAISDDEEEEARPENPEQTGRTLGAKAIANQAHLSPNTVLDALTEALALCPAAAELYAGRAAAYLQAGRPEKAITDYTTALELAEGEGQAQRAQAQGQASATYDWLMGRAAAKELLGDAKGAMADVGAARGAARTERERSAAQDRRAQLVQVQVAQRRQQEKLAAAAPVHRFRTGATIQEMPEDIDEKAQQSAERWQHAGLSQAAKARAQAARQLKLHEEAVAQATKENQSRRERNKVRAARRRAAAAAAAAAAEEQRKTLVLQEETRIPVDDEEQADAGPVQEQEAQQQRHEQQKQQEQDGHKGEEPPFPSAGAPAASLAAQEQGAAAAGAAATSAEAEAEALAEQASPELPPAQAANGVHAPKPEQAKQAEQSTEDTAAAAAATAAAGAAARVAEPSEAELDVWKDQADGLQREGNPEEAVALYRKYLQHRPADLRVWANLAQACCTLGDHRAGLEACDQAAAVRQPSHGLAAHKLPVRRASALQGLGRLKEALAELEKAEAAAGGDSVALKQIAKRQQQVIAALEARGQAPAPSGGALPPNTPPLDKGKQPAAAAAAAEATPSPPPSGAAAVAAAPAAAAAPAQAAGAQGQGQEHEAAPSGAEEAEREAARAKRRQERREREQKERQLGMAKIALDKGRLMARSKAWQAAAEEFEEAEALLRDLGQSSWEASGNLSLCLVQLGLWKEAAEAASRALRVDPGYTKARYRRALALWRQGNLALALPDMHRAAQESPDDARVQRELRQLESEARQKGMDVDALTADRCNVAGRPGQ